MEPAEIQARATIAAALISSRAIPAEQIDVREHWFSEHRGKRLRELTDFIYRAISEVRTSAGS